MFVEPYFWCLLLVAAAVARALPLQAAVLRSVVLAFFSAVLLGIHLGPWVTAVAVVLTLWLSLAGRILARRTEKAGLFLVLGMFSPVLLLWVAGKTGDGILLQNHRWIAFAGLSFFLVRAWTFLKDAGDGRLKDFRFEHVWGYLLFFPSFLMGPMPYYHEYEASVREPESLNGEAFVDVVFRVAVGLTKIYLIAPTFAPFSLQSFQGAESFPVGPTLLAALSYSVVIWADFSGFSDVAIACGRLLGIRIPENFRSPYLAPNIREFWQRWHITFSRVLTSYLFVPLSRSLTKRLGNRPRTVMATGYLLTFAFCGYWHGPTLNFVFWGLYHALGLIVFDLLKKPPQRRVAKSEGKSLPYIPLLKSASSIVLTFLFVSAGWFFFVIKF